MHALLRYLKIVVGVAVLGSVAGLGAELVSRQAGWWLVGLLGGAVLGSLVGARSVPSPREPRGRT